MPRRVSYNTFGGPGARQAWKNKQRIYFAGSLVLCTLLLFIFAVVLLLTVRQNDEGQPGALAHTAGSCSNVDRFNCIPEGNPSQSLCEKRGCCWDKSSTLPQCYYPAGFSYALDGQVNRAPPPTVLSLQQHRPNSKESCTGPVFVHASIRAPPPNYVGPTVTRAAQYRSSVCTREHTSPTPNCATASATRAAQVQCLWTGLVLQLLRLYRTRLT